MFVMLFGLMGVAAIMPVGNHYAARSDQYDRGAALAGSAFAELKSRGILNPAAWSRANPAGILFIDPTTGTFSTAPANGAGHAFVIDPIGAAQAANEFFPYDGGGDTKTPAEWTNPPGGGPGLTGQVWPIRRVTLPHVTGGTMPSQVADSIFRLRDDLSGELPTEGDRPGIQRWETDNNGTPDYPADDTLLARAYAGSYSWLATVLPVNSDALLGLQPANSRHGSFLYEVSVAVFRKREDEPSEASERSIFAEMGPGGDLVIFAPDNDVNLVDQASQDIRAGNWIALAGVHPTTGKFLLKWYRLLSFDDETTENVTVATGTGLAARWAMVDGPEWPTDPTAAVGAPVIDLRAILLPNVIGVATQTVKLETN
jgi:hypothetical protein